MTSADTVRATTDDNDDTARDHALAWLTGRLQWERLLADLHRRADVDGEPVALDEWVDEPAAQAA